MIFLDGSIEISRSEVWESFAREFFSLRCNQNSTCFSLSNCADQGMDSPDW